MDSNKSFFEDAIENLETDENYREFFELLKLPDEDFLMVSPLIISNIEKTFASIPEKIALIQVLNAQGLTIEDVQSAYNTVIEYLDGKMAGEISGAKRDFIKNILTIVYNGLADARGIGKKIVTIPIELCHPDAKLPTYAHLGDAGMDIYTVEDLKLAPGETKLVPTGIKVNIPLGYELQVCPKSGRSSKLKLRIANAPGIVDANFTGEIKVIAENIEPEVKHLYSHYTDEGKLIIDGIDYGAEIIIPKGEKIAQLVLNEVPTVSWQKVEHITENTDRGDGGFGSTGNT